MTQAELDMHVLFVEVFWPIRVLPRLITVRNMSDTPRRSITMYGDKVRPIIRGYMLQLLKEIKNEQANTAVASD